MQIWTCVKKSTIINARHVLPWVKKPSKLASGCYWLKNTIHERKIFARSQQSRHQFYRSVAPSTTITGYWLIMANNGKWRVIKPFRFICRHMNFVCNINRAIVPLKTSITTFLHAQLDVHPPNTRPVIRLSLLFYPTYNVNSPIWQWQHCYQDPFEALSLIKTIEKTFSTCRKWPKLTTAVFSCTPPSISTFLQLRPMQFLPNSTPWTRIPSTRQIWTN